jgi:hypothetical protein
MIKRMLLGVAILFGMLLLLLPKSDEGSKKKMVSAAMLMCSNDFRQAVAAQLRRDEAVELVFDNSCPELIATLVADEKGTVTLRGARHGITMVLTPVAEPGGLRWRCQGEPAEIITRLCRP